MRINKFCCLFLAMFMDVAALAQRSADMIAPLFPIQYSPSAVHFDVAPAAVGRLCSVLHKYEPNVWVYASFKSGDAEYYVVSGYLQGVTGKMEPDETGAAVEIRQGNCSLVNAEWATTGLIEPGKEAELPQDSRDVLPGLNAPRICLRGECHYWIRSQREKAVLDGLLSDALVRFAKAFGGREKLLAAFHQNMPDPQHLDPIVRRSIEEYERR